MALEQNKILIRRFIDAYNARILDLFDDLVSPYYIDHTHNQQWRESFRQLFSIAFEGFPDWHEEIKDMIAEGDRVWVRVTMS
jgi:C-1 hydroxylase